MVKVRPEMRHPESFLSLPLSWPLDMQEHTGREEDLSDLKPCLIWMILPFQLINPKMANKSGLLTVSQKKVQFENMWSWASYSVFCQTWYKQKSIHVFLPCSSVAVKNNTESQGELTPAAGWNKLPAASSFSLSQSHACTDKHRTLPWHAPQNNYHMDPPAFITHPSLFIRLLFYILPCLYFL